MAAAAVATAFPSRRDAENHHSLVVAFRIGVHRRQHHRNGAVARRSGAAFGGGVDGVAAAADGGDAAAAADEEAVGSVCFAGAVVSGRQRLIAAAQERLMVSQRLQAFLGRQLLC